jgi:hypothetical protein
MVDGTTEYWLEWLIVLDLNRMCLSSPIDPRTSPQCESTAEMLRHKRIINSPSGFPRNEFLFFFRINGFRKLLRV